MKTNLVIVALLIISNISLSQSLRGKIMDAESNPLEDATIFLLGNKNNEHVHTNHTGQFIINDANIGDSILVKFLGFNSQVIVINNLKNALNVNLTESFMSLNEVTILPKIDAINIFTDINLKTAPVTSSQEVLRKVPGLVIGQHAGGGKAEQMFLRGFDIDHGTDINISVDGMPINMVSHAHGQGYADLHFIIPEAIKNIDFGKGPYMADKGNFTTAGYVNFKTKETLENNTVKMEAGMFNTQRILAMYNILKTKKQNLYIASDYQMTDGPFVSPQAFSRQNLMSKYTGVLTNHDKISLSVSHFKSIWNASGQIPQRLVDAGMSRFGSVDDTEGGNTSRTNFVLSYIKNINENSYIKNTIYNSHYDFELYSDFTFFLNDSINGDQIRQKENRYINGFQSEYIGSFKLGKTNLLLKNGIGFRNDKTNNTELSNTANRKTTLKTLKLGDINETNMFAYINPIFEIGKWKINPSIRLDQFNFNYYDKLLTNFTNKSETEYIVSPKINILYNVSDDMQLYIKSGKGFHSNDTRVVVEQKGEKILPSAYGTDIGYIWKPTSQLLVNMAYWYLFLEQEFVYVGDAGIIEPSGKSQRQGIDFSYRLQFGKYLYINGDANYTLARSIEEEEGKNFIPLAPDLTITQGISFIHKSGFYGNTSLRYIKNRPANEDNSIVAIGYAIIDMNMGYQRKKFDIGFSIQNLLNTDWNETQFATETRLQNEAHSVEEIHFTPGIPFCFKASIAYKF